MDSNSSDDTSSDYSTETSDDDGMETAQINGIKVQLPQGLCERLDIFKEFFTTDLWNSLSEVNKQHLRTFLPNFPENDEYEKSKTLQRLFNFDIFKFNSPLIKFHEDLKAGYFRPDIARMRKIIRKAEKKEAMYRYRTYKEQLKYEVIESQCNLLTQIRNLPPGVEPKQERRKLNVDYVTHRTKRRYFQILGTIKTKCEDAGCSSDENYAEGPPAPLSRKQKRHLNGIKNSLSTNKERFFYSTMTSKVNSFDLEKYITPNHNPFYINDESYKSLCNQHKRRKLECAEDPDLNTKGITLTDIINRTQLPYVKPITSPPKHQIDSKSNHKRKIKKELPFNNRSPEVVRKRHRLSTHSSNSDSDSDSLIDAVSFNTPSKVKLKTSKSSKPLILPQTPKIKTEIKEEPDLFIPPVLDIPADTSNLIKPINKFSQYGKITPVKVEDLEGIDVMDIPIDLDNANIDILGLTVKPELMQDTHANFFSLIRDVICSTSEHRMNMYTLQERLKSWQENPISPLNDWYNLTDNWIGLLPSAITFLCGNSSEQPDDFVPYMEYKISVDMYQWIGAGRDSDTLLSSLCQFWLDHRFENRSATPTRDKDELDLDVTDRAQTPPPPRCPTNWSVRKATMEEIKDFREQERKRYDNPHKAFTYRCNGYESVVGPLKGIYNPAVGNTKARGHTMLSADRPNFVTILSLVRDATARLPNGEGTRAEICELLKSSQYISQTAPDNILQSVVSGALDRMHTQFDPCVKYDPKRKIWIYLHRNRTEEDFERIHQQYQTVNKTKKPTVKKSPAKPKVKPEKVIKPQKVEPLTNITVQEKPKVTKKPPVATKLISNSTDNTVPTLVTVAPQKTSLLLSSNIQKQESSQNNPQVLETIPALKQQTQEEKEIKEALQAIAQNQVSSPTIKSGKSIVKILSPSQGKSLIIPTTNPQIIKQIQEHRNAQSKQLVTQQLLQTIQSQQKQLNVQKQADGSERSNEQKIKVSANLQQQIMQSINPQQLQNIKNVTLLRTQNQNVGLSTASTISSQLNDSQSTVVTVAVSKQTGSQDQIVQPSVQIKTHGNLTPAQQQQILQTIKQKILPQAAVLTSPQQIILKHKGVTQIQKQTAAGASLLGQPKIATVGDTTSKAVSSSQGPMVAKVLTNAAGQVISVESLLAHQKQHGSLPQGTTLRVSGAKTGQQNIIQLAASSKANSIAQFTVTSQNNLIAVSSQPKLVVASQTTSVTSTVTTTKPATRTVSKPQPVTKFTPKVAQQLINAKIIAQNVDGQKVVQPKLVMGQQNQIKLQQGKTPNASKAVTLNVAGNSSTIRMVNAANLNLTHIGGKPVLLASKGSAIQNLGQNVILQAQPSSGGTSLVLQNPVKNSSANIQQSTNLISQQNIVFGSQVKVQQPQVVISSGVKSSVSQNVTQGHIMLSGHPVRLHTSSASNTQRVVLASQGQGGQIVAQQILLPAGFQGTAINIKALQGVKVIPIAQAHGAGKGIQTRQVYARVMNPSVIKTSSSNSLLEKPTVPTTE